MSMHVKLIYGPYESHYTVKHKKQRLRGLINRLLMDRYRVELIKSSSRNIFIVEMCGKEVFRCNITSLQFNTDYRYDPICQRAISAIREATVCFQHSDDFDWMRTIVSDLVWEINVFTEVPPGKDKIKHEGRFTPKTTFKYPFERVKLPFIDFIGQRDWSDDELDELSEVEEVRREIRNLWGKKNLLFLHAPDRYALVREASLELFDEESAEDFSEYPGGEELNRYVQERRQQELDRRQARIEEAVLWAELHGDIEPLHMARRKKKLPPVFPQGFFLKNCRCFFCEKAAPLGLGRIPEALACTKPPDKPEYI